jgi:hypothetical protein
MGAHKCQFGTTHKMCRCPKEHAINCPTPDECKEKAYAQADEQCKRPAEATSGYTVELGGEVFTQAQWEAVQEYVQGRIAQVTTRTVDGAIDNPDVLDQLPLDERIRNGL